MTTTIGLPDMRAVHDPHGYKMEVRTCTPEQMQKRVARFSELKCPPNRYADSKLPGHERKNYLVVGTGLQMKDAAEPMSAIPVDDGFQLGYATMKPGNGPALHNHDTNETFIAINGTWRVVWGLEAEHAIDLAPLDVCAVPAFVPRTFICLTPGEGQDEGLIMAIIPGYSPKSEFN